ncbi:MAG: hypothetical protein MZV63_66145 [Marinilabiliales bacterium]|nr:hypothetical protein [Marinilabiliales bacterium]
MFTITSLIAVPFDGTFSALTHTEDYLVKLYRPRGEQGRPGVPPGLRPGQRRTADRSGKEGRHHYQRQALHPPRAQVRERRQEPSRPQQRDLGRHVDEGQVQGHPRRRLRRRGRLSGLFLAPAFGNGDPEPPVAGPVRPRRRNPLGGRGCSR